MWMDKATITYRLDYVEDLICSQRPKEKDVNKNMYDTIPKKYPKINELISQMWRAYPENRKKDHDSTRRPNRNQRHRKKERKATLYRTLVLLAITMMSETTLPLLPGWT